MVSNFKTTICIFFFLIFTIGSFGFISSVGEAYLINENIENFEYVASSGSDVIYEGKIISSYAASYLKDNRSYMALVIYSSDFKTSEELGTFLENNEDAVDNSWKIYNNTYGNQIIESVEFGDFKSFFWMSDGVAVILYEFGEERDSDFFFVFSLAYLEKYESDLKKFVSGVNLISPINGKDVHPGNVKFEFEVLTKEPLFCMVHLNDKELIYQNENVENGKYDFEYNVEIKDFLMSYYWRIVCFGNETSMDKVGIFEINKKDYDKFFEEYIKTQEVINYSDKKEQIRQENLFLNQTVIVMPLNNEVFWGKDYRPSIKENLFLGSDLALSLFSMVALLALLVFFIVARKSVHK